MKIGLLGTGRLATTLAKRWQPTHEIMFGSREPETAKFRTAEKGCGDIPIATIQECARQADVIVLCFPWYAFTDVDRLLTDELDGKVVLDFINPLKSTGSLALGHKWSAGEEIAQTWHKAHVVKSFNHIYYTNFNNPIVEGQSLSGLYCTNSDKGRDVADALGRDLGLAPVYAGPIKNARLLEPMAVLWMQLAFTVHHNTQLAIQIAGLELQ